MAVELVQRTLYKAIRSPVEPEAFILHSDEGSQYTSVEYEEVHNYDGMTQSFSLKSTLIIMPVFELGMDS